MEIAQYVALCTRLSRFVQLQTLSADDATLLCATCGEFMAFYAQEERQQQQQDHQQSPPNAFSLLGGVSSTTMDDIVLLTMQKLLLGIIITSEPRVKESVFQVLARVLARNALKIRTFSEQKLLGFLQSCVLYLPTPDAALDRSGEKKQQSANKSVQTQSEELRLHILACMELLLRNRASDLRLSISSATPSSSGNNTEQMHFFAYVVSALLHIGEHDRCRPAATLAVETLALLMRFLHDPVLLRQFFPGVSVGMWKTINAPQQSSKLAVTALRCLAQSIKLCISDAVTQSNGVRDGASAFTIEALRALSRQTNEAKREASETAETKQDAWLQETTVNVDIVLSKLFASIQVAHKSWRIREALVELCGAVVLSSRVTLRDSFFRCYEELLVMRVDPISEVSSSAQRVIEALQNELSTDEWLQMVPVLADRFQMHLSTLSLKCSTDHESAGVSLMRKLVGYVSFLGKRLGSYLDASMDAIYAALCRVLEFDAIDIDLVLHQKYIDAVNNVENEENGDNGAREKALTTSQFQKRLRYFHEEESVKTATQLLLAIGSISTPALFIDCAFTLLTSEGGVEDRHAEVFLVLNGFLKAYVKTPQEGLNSNKDTLDQLQGSAEAPQEQNGVDVHLVGRILEDLLVLDAWSEHSDSSHHSRHRTRRSLKAAVAQRALMVECVGICVEILHRDFGVFLLHTLYPLVEKLGSRDVEVEHAALAALHKVYFFCGYASVEALFEANMDYFVDALCSRLEHLEAFPLTALVVEGLLRHTKIASLPLVDEVANSLLRSVDLYQDSPYISSLLRALKLLLSSMTASGGTFEKTKCQQEGFANDSGGDPMTRDLSGSLLSQFIKEIRILSNEKSAYADDEPANSTPASKQDKQEDTSDEARMKGAMPVEYDERSALDGPQEDDDDDDTEDQPEEDAQEASQYTALVVEILDRSGHFLSESEPIACCLVLSIIEEGVLLLHKSRKELLPLIHRLWGSLLHRLEVTNKPIVTATIRLVNTLAQVAGDFIGERFVENVWPALRKHLRGMELLTEKNITTQVTRSMLLLASAQDASETSDLRTEQPQATTATSHRRTQDSQLLVAALECLATVCSKSSAVTFIVPEVAATTKKYLNAHFPQQVVHASKQLFVALAELNGDEVFCALAPLADWMPPRPPSTSFPAFTADATRPFYKAHVAGNSGATSAVSRENAACLIRQLVRNQ